ncbi:MAG: HEAT repeat domain-containing protein [Methanomassiliicoccales archaeon]|jgi:vesicle coat complex subunit
MQEEARIEEGLRSIDRDEVLRVMNELEGLLRVKAWSGPIPIPICESLGSADPEMRMKAAWLVGKFAQNKIAAELPLEAVVVLASDPEEETRENVAWAIGEAAGAGQGGIFEAEAMMRLLDDESAQVRGMAAWALGRLAEKRHVRLPSEEAKLKSLLGDHSEYVRKTSAWALERF